MDTRFQQLKHDNVQELTDAYGLLETIEERKITLTHGTDVRLTYPTPYGRGSGGGGGNNQLDVVITSGPSGHTKETIEISRKLSRLKYDIEAVGGILKWILEFQSTRRSTWTLDGDETRSVSFTIPDYYVPFKAHNCKGIRDKRLQSLILQLLMIGMNDNGRYRGCNGWGPGFANHMAVAVSAFHLFHENGSYRIKEYLRNRGISDRRSFKRFLVGKNIIRYTDIIDMI